MTITIYTDPQGMEHTSLPRTWRNATNITEAWALAHGWRTESREVPDPVPQPERYSKYKLHLALEREGLWTSFWDAISRAGYSQFWNDAQDLAEDDPMFSSALSMLTVGSPGEEAVIRADKSVVESILEEAKI